MKRKNRLWGWKSVRVLLIVMLVAGIFRLQFFLSSAGEANDRNSDYVVRVGWYLNPMFQEGTSDEEPKSGYSYDYLQKIADYTFWRYEYVYGDWPDLLRMLQTGEIDLMAGVSVSEERAKTILFPESAMGMDQYCIYKRTEDTSISVNDLSSFAGKKVGGIIDSRMTVLTEQWISENQPDMEMVYFNSYQEQDAAFEKGEIDLMTQTFSNVMGRQGISLVLEVGEEPFYLAVSKQKSNLLAELNNSIDTMLSIDPYVFQRMEYTNYGENFENISLTTEEKQWVASHPTVVVGYLDNYLPYSDRDDNGNATGLMTDVLTAIIRSLQLENDLSVEYQSYRSFEEMVKDLKGGRIDIAFPVYGNLWDLEQDGIDASAEVVCGNETFFYKGNYQRDQINTIAINRNNKMQSAYCGRYFPEVQQIEYPSIEACLQAVLEGEADGTIINTLRTELVTGNSTFQSLSYVQLEGADSRCFGVNEHSTSLLLLLNRGLKSIGSSYGIDHSYKYMESFYQYGAMDFIRDNFLWISLILVSIVGAIILLLVLNLHSKGRDVREKEAYIRQLDAINLELERLKQEADAANAAKTSFLFNMSHDIRTPMNAILGYNNMMEKELDQPDRLKQHLEKVQKSGEFLLTLINNVLEVARIDSGKESVDESVYDLTDDSSMVVSIFENELKKKHLDFTSDMNVTHRYIYVDVRKIREITINLLSNAIKYTPEGGRIHMQFDEIPCDREGYATFVLTVQDTGIGMSREFCKQIFDSFTRERNTTESKVPGSGLGMAIVKRLVDLMGGTIEVESEKGKGSCFRVTLTHRIVPEEDQEPVKQKDPLTEKVNLTGKRILLAEDNELNTEIAVAILENVGAMVEHAGDGIECVNMLVEKEAGYYDMILMDIQMPNLNGYDAARRIRALEDPVKAGIPIFAVTANAFEEDRKNALDAGMNGHLAKPIEIPKLMEILATL